MVSATGLMANRFDLDQINCIEDRVLRVDGARERLAYILFEGYAMDVE